MPRADHPLRRDGLLRRTWPFAAALVVAFASLVVVDEIPRPGLVVAAGVLGVAVAIAVAVVPWERLPRAVAVTPPLAVIVIGFLLRRGTGRLGDPVDYEALLLVPVFWLALYGTRTEMVAAVALGAAGFCLSILLAEESADAWVKALLWPAVAGLVGMRAQTLVADVRRLSTTDGLTGLANRARWDDELERELARARRTSSGLAVALIDLDHFKRINDEHGHRAGDAVLRACAEAWSGELRRGDFIARYGGEEFGVLLPGTGRAEASAVAERIRAATPGGATCSIGLAVAIADGQPDLVRRADEALYAAKRRGRDRIVVAS